MLQLSVVISSCPSACCGCGSLFFFFFSGLYLCRKTQPCACTARCCLGVCLGEIRWLLRPGLFAYACECTCTNLVCFNHSKLLHNAIKLYKHHKLNTQNTCWNLCGLCISGVSEMMGLGHVCSEMGNGKTCRVEEQSREEASAPARQVLCHSFVCQLTHRWGAAETRCHGDTIDTII